MDRIQLIQRKLLPVLMAVFISISLFYYLYVNIYYRAKLSAAKTKLESIGRSALPNSQIVYNRFEDTAKFKEITSQLGEKEESVKTTIPTIKNFGSFADQLQKLAGDCDVEVVNMNIFNPSSDSLLDIFQMKIKLECRSTYKSFKKFLWCLENCTNVIFIDKLKIMNKLSEEKINYTYDLISYVRK